MTVTLTPRRWLQRRDSYSGITRVVSDGQVLALHCAAHATVFVALSTVAAIALDEDGGALE
jgi:hypothetical protein